MFKSDLPGTNLRPLTRSSPFELPFGVTVMFVLVLMLSACASAPQAIIGVYDPEVSPTAIAEAKRHDVYIATTRAPDADPAIMFSGERGDGLKLARVTVTIPPNHVPGKIEQTKRLPPDPRTAFTVLDPVTFSDESSFLSNVNSALADRPKGQRNTLLFVHGYNTTLPAALLRVAQFVEDTGFTGVPVLFSWASRGKTLQYVYDLNSALHARDALISTATLIARSRSESADIVAHSMGNFLTVEAIRQAKLTDQFNKTGRLNNIILASPDIDADVFKSQLALLGKDERQFYVLISEDDKALAFSRRIAGGVDRVGDEPADELAALGVNVIDLSKVKDSTNLHHSKFADSPEVVQLIGNGILAGHAPSGRETGGALTLGFQQIAADISGPR